MFIIHMNSERKSTNDTETVQKTFKKKGIYTKPENTHEENVQNFQKNAKSEFW